MLSPFLQSQLIFVVLRSQFVIDWFLRGITRLYQSWIQFCLHPALQTTFHWYMQRRDGVLGLDGERGNAEREPDPRSGRSAAASGRRRQFWAGGCAASGIVRSGRPPDALLAVVDVGRFHVRERAVAAATASGNVLHVHIIDTVRRPIRVVYGCPTRWTQPALCLIQSCHTWNAKRMRWGYRRC